MHKLAPELQPASHPERYLSLDNLALALHRQFTQSDQREDLEEAILSLRQCLDLQRTLIDLCPSTTSLMPYGHYLRSQVNPGTWRRPFRCIDRHSSCYLHLILVDLGASETMPSPCQHDLMNQVDARTWRRPFCCIDRHSSCYLPPIPNNLSPSTALRLPYGRDLRSRVNVRIWRKPFYCIDSCKLRHPTLDGLCPSKARPPLYVRDLSNGSTRGPGGGHFFAATGARAATCIST